MTTRSRADTRHLPSAVCKLLLLVISVPAQGAAAASDRAPWRPDPQRYAYRLKEDMPVRMDDGVVLRADEYYPTNTATGAQTGRFPVLLMQTPYGRARAVEKLADYFVRRGYVLVVADLRGFGESQGQAAWFGARAGRDGAQLAEWVAKLPEANGKVGLIGCSYSGVVQFFTAYSLARRSPVKAMAPFCVDSNFYHDLTAFGGIPTQFLLAVRAITKPGVDDDPTNDPFMRTIISEATGDDAFYSEYWQSVNVTALMPKIVSTGIPILTQAGWRDLAPGSNIDAEVAAENAVAHRPLEQPLKAGAVLSGRYQAIVGNWTHGEHTADTLLRTMLRWFDTWLKGRATGMADTDKPLHLYLTGENRWIDSATYPITDQATTFYLSPGPSAGDGTLRSDGVGKVCTEPSRAPAPCTQALIRAPDGPGATLSFDTGRLQAPLNITGPASLTLYLRSTRREVELSATLFDVDADGHANKVTNGAQLGSQRALDPGATWYSEDGRLIRPAHFFTKAKREPVPIGEAVRIDIELVPAMIHIPPGHLLRLVVASQPPEDFRQYGPTVQLPNPLAPTPEELTDLVGGIYTILFGAAAPSAINLSTASESDLVSSTEDWGPGS